MLQKHTPTVHGSHRAAAGRLHRDREEKTGVDYFKKTDVASLRTARCLEKGRKIGYGDSRDVHRLSRVRNKKKNRAQRELESLLLVFHPSKSLFSTPVDGVMRTMTTSAGCHTLASLVHFEGTSEAGRNPPTVLVNR